MKKKFPCELCLVRAACKIYCDDYYDFINYWAKALFRVTADEIHEFRMNTPPADKHEVEKLIQHGNGKYEVVRDKMFINLRTRDHPWNYQKRGGRSA